MRHQAELSDYMNFILGKYIAFSVNDPKKYPLEPYTSAQKEKEMSDDFDGALQRIAIATGANNGNNNR